MCTVRTRKSAKCDTYSLVYFNFRRFVSDSPHLYQNFFYCIIFIYIFLYIFREKLRCVHT